MKHRTLALLLAAAMLFALASCGGAPAASDSPSPSQSGTPSESPSETPSEKPSEKPSESPSETPSESPSEEPSESPSEEPSETPSEKPSESPSEKPSETPSEKPSETPSEKPSESPLPSPSDGQDLVESGVLPTPKPPADFVPSPPPGASTSPSPAPSQGSSVDLQKFYEGLLVTDTESADYFNPEAPVEGDALAAYYPGLEDIAAKQRVIYQPMMSAVACEIALVEVENAADVQKVKDIFQARIDAQVGTDDSPGGAWYPETIEGWKNNSRIVSNGSCVMLIVWKDCDKFVEEFNGLF